jgi:hypothetical protein
VIEHLPADMRRRWTYFGRFANVYFDIYPECLDYLRVLPLAACRTLIRARTFDLPDDRRAGRHALNVGTRNVLPNRSGSNIDSLRDFTESRIRMPCAASAIERRIGLPNCNPTWRA